MNSKRNKLAPDSVWPDSKPSILVLLDHFPGSQALKQPNLPVNWLDCCIGPHYDGHRWLYTSSRVMVVMTVKKK